MTKNEALKMAIEAMEYNIEWYNIGDKGIDKSEEAINACKEALEQPAQDTETMAVAIALQEQIRQLKEQPAQEPVAERFWVIDGDKSHWTYDDYDKSEGWQPLYTHPHQWVGLTDDEIGNAFHASISKEKYETGLSVGLFARAIEQALKDKNT